MWTLDLTLQTFAEPEFSFCSAALQSAMFRIPPPPHRPTVVWLHEFKERLSSQCLLDHLVPCGLPYLDQFCSQ